jgi:hypothetical protein
MQLLTASSTPSKILSVKQFGGYLRLRHSLLNAQRRPPGKGPRITKLATL